MGALIAEHDGTVDRFAGDGILIFFNDPLPVPDAGQRAPRDGARDAGALPPLRARWAKLGYELDLGIGIAQGFATLGAFGFEGRVGLHGDRRRRRTSPIGSATRRAPGKC